MPQLYHRNHDPQVKQPARGGLMRLLKHRLPVVCVLFSLAFTAVFGACLIYHIRDNLKKSQVESIRYELNSAGILLEENLNSISQIVYYATNEVEILRLLGEGSPDKNAAIGINRALRDKITLASLDPYINKLMLLSRDRVWVTTGQVNGLPRDYDVFQQLAYRAEITAADTAGWSGIYPDQFAQGRAAQDVIPMIREVTDYGRNTIGYVYVSLQPAIILDRIARYSALRQGDFYLRIGGRFYSLYDGRFHLCDISGGDGIFTSRGQQSAAITVDGVTRNAVIANLDRDWSLIQTVPPLPILYDSDVRAIVLIAGLSMAILSLFLYRIIRSLVTRPVSLVLDQLSISTDEGAPLGGVREELSGASTEFAAISEGIEDMRTRMNAMMRQELEREKEKSKLEFDLLQYQINPHFIGNTLNTIKWMADLQQSPGISELSTALYDLFQSMIRTQDAVIPLHRELLFLKNYVTIQKYRYRDIFDFELDVSPVLEDSKILKFMLQPIVENAIMHGIASQQRFGLIRLEMSLDGDIVRAVLSDNGKGMTAEQIDAVLHRDRPAESSVNKIGVHNVQQRILRHYGPGCGISIESEPGRYTKVTVTYPFTQ